MKQGIVRKSWTTTVTKEIRINADDPAQVERVRHLMLLLDDPEITEKIARMMNGKCSEVADEVVGALWQEVCKVTS